MTNLNYKFSVGEVGLSGGLKRSGMSLAAARLTSTARVLPRYYSAAVTRLSCAVSSATGVREPHTLRDGIHEVSGDARDRDQLLQSVFMTGELSRSRAELLGSSTEGRAAKVGPRGRQTETQVSRTSQARSNSSRPVKRCCHRNTLADAAVYAPETAPTAVGLDQPESSPVSPFFCHSADNSTRNN